MRKVRFNPLAADGDDLFALPALARLERCSAVLLGAHVLLDEMPERAGANPGNAKQTVLALHETHREAVDAEHVLALQSVGVVPAEHVLVAREVRKDREQ